MGVGGGALLQAGFLRSLDRLTDGRTISGQIIGAPAAHGHRLKDGGFPEPSSLRKTACVIVGGGMAGLSAAWRLNKRGVRDFELLELDHEAGGNSRSGSNPVSAYPWGAHYVPIQNLDSSLALELFQDLGVIRGHDDRGLPIYEELFVCAAPDERLYIRGKWQEGYIPKRGSSPRDARQFTEFMAHIEHLKTAKGEDGKPAFAVPIALSSKDPSFMKWDHMTMASYLEAHGWDSPYLRWYVNYITRDEFGCTLDKASAWAALNCLAAQRGGAANALASEVVTWPEGNGWLVNQLARQFRQKITTKSLVYRVANRPGGGVVVDYADVETNQTHRIEATTAIVATPRFITGHIVEGFSEDMVSGFKSFTYAPWMIANVTVRDLPEWDGLPMAWDNVSFHGESIGYVNATHQRVSRYPARETVLTNYWPLSGEKPAEARKRAFGMSHGDWVAMILKELAPLHPGFEKSVESIDVWLWGHGMIVPTPGFISSEATHKAAMPLGSISFAHSDLSGLSRFEEAQYWGVRAADQVMERVTG